MPSDVAGSGDPLGRIDRMIEQYRRAKILRLRRRALVVWQKLQARQAIVDLEKPTESVH
jgi:hypothetical protein